MSGWLLLGGYAVVIAPVFAIIAWGLARHFGRLDARPAALGAMLTWAALAGAPIAGLIADRARSSNGCGAARECYEHFFAVMGVPAGWALAILVVLAATFVGRLNARAPSP